MYPLMVLYLVRMCQCGILMRRHDAESCSTEGPLFPLSVPLKLSCWPRIRWCGTGGFQEPGQCSIPTIVFYYFPLSLFSVGIVRLGSLD